ncbi:hypothetical protein JMJ35_006368 [Cladonia borealis]|uniref:Signal peptidase complex subunit 2 n=1 Tax=Cladonia borealis TaxID=184061 RepID=A0AA39QZS8_9LECA|nr:hypothetical protein JMJ35_006368 [Cladonia borealis]
MSSQKIAVYSLSDLKNTTDDALPNYLTSLKFAQSHLLTDVRLALGYTAVIIAGATFYADWKLGWDATKYWTFWAVLVYFMLNGVLTVWIWGVEKGTVFRGEINHASAGRNTLSISSSVTKHIPIYNITVTSTDPTGRETKTQLSSPFTRWFDADGFFIAKPFQQWLAAEIPLIGQVDRKNAPGGEGMVGGREEAMAVVVEGRLETPRKGGAGEMMPPGSTRSRKGRKG